MQGGGMPLGMTGGLYAYTTNLQNLQNDSITIPHPLRGSPLCTRGPLRDFAPRQLPLHMEPLGDFALRQLLLHMEPYGDFALRQHPLLRDLFLLPDCYSKKGR